MSDIKKHVNPTQFYKRPIDLLILTLIVAFVLLVYMSWDMYKNNQESISTNNYNLQVEDLKGLITYYDEVLTMSARMASLTGDLIWEDRYNQFVTLLDDALAKAQSLAPESYTSQLATITSEANNKLISMETHALAAVKNNDTRKATDIMFSSAYRKQKDIYKKGNTNFSIPKQLDLRLRQLKHQIVYLDEVLTMSARMASLTGDRSWEDRYLEHVPILDAAIHEATQLVIDQLEKERVSQTAEANEKLIAMETRAFDLVRKKRPGEAQQILLGKEYEKQKLVYSSGMEEFSALIESTIKDTNQIEKIKTKRKIVLIFLVIMMTTIATLLVTRHVQLAENELARQNRDLERKTDELESFAYSLSHDLRAPLKTIQGFSQRLQKKLSTENDQELSLYCEQINKNALRLDGLIDDTLAITRSENLVEDHSEINFEQILSEIQMQFSEINRENPVAFKVHFKHKKSLFSQQTRINQIFANLISNSIKYAKSAEHNPYVEIATENLSDEMFEIRIKDNGIGVAKEQHDKMFSMFFRAQSSVSFGSGLGLHLVRKNVEKLGGNINFNSSEEGTEFIIQLPQTT